MSKPLKCGKCIQCCQWGDADSLRPVLLPHEVAHYQSELVHGLPRLAAGAVIRECVYLDWDGCKIHDTRPQVCRDFDCRRLYQDTSEGHGLVFIKILLQGALRSEDDKDE